MNFRKRSLIITIRTLLGLFIIFSGVTGLMAGNNGMQGVPEPMIEASQNLWDVGIFQMIKVTEIIAGLMLVCGFLPALAVLFFAPIAVGIIVFNSIVSPEYLFGGIMVFIFNAYLGYAYWDKYRSIFTKG